MCRLAISDEFLNSRHYPLEIIRSKRKGWTTTSSNFTFINHLNFHDWVHLPVPVFKTD